MAISGTIVQYGAEGGTTTPLVVDGSSTVTWASPTSGNLLLAVATIDGGNADHTITWPSGFTEIQGHHGSLGFQNQGGIAWKVATGSETSFSFSVASASSIDWNVGVVELPATDLDLSGVDASAEDVSEANSGDTTSSSGSASNTVADALVIAVHTFERGDFWDGSPTYSSGFTEQLTIPATLNANSGLVLATKVASSIASQSNTYTVTDTAGRNCGFLAIFAGSSNPVVSLSDDELELGDSGLDHGPISAGSVVGTVSPAFGSTIDEATLDGVDVSAYLSSTSTTGFTLGGIDESLLGPSQLLNTVPLNTEVDLVIETAAAVSVTLRAAAPTRAGVITNLGSYAPGAAEVGETRLIRWLKGEGTSIPEQGLDYSTATIYESGEAEAQEWVYHAGAWIAGTSKTFTEPVDESSTISPLTRDVQLNINFNIQGNPNG